MNDIRDLFPGRMRERTFQLKAKRDAGAVWHEPQFVECKQCGRRASTHPVDQKPFRLPQLRLSHAHRRILPAESGIGSRQLPGTGCRPASAGCAQLSGLQ